MSVTSSRRPVSTIAQVRALKAEAKQYESRDAALRGGYIVVYPSGALAYAVRYRVHNQKQKVTLGALDLASGGLAEMRAKARKALAEVDDARHSRTGEPDPAAARRVARAERIAAEAAARAAKRVAKQAGKDGLVETAQAPDSVEGAVDLFIKRHLAGLRTGAAVARVLTREVAARWRGRRLAEITRADIHELLDEVGDRAPVQSARLKAYLSKLFRFAMSRDLIEKNPTENIERPNAETVRDRSLVDKKNGDPGELLLAWRASATLGYPFEPIVKLLILTGARLSEVAEGRWSEIDFTTKSWTLAPERTKNEEEHKIPLSPAALEILESLPRRSGVDLIFSTTGATAVSGFSKAKRNLDAAIATLNDGKPIPAWRLHDFRRSVAVGLAAMGVAVHVTEKILGHTSGSFKGITKVYQQFDYAPEKRDALTKWGEHVARIVSGADEEKIAENFENVASASPLLTTRACPT